MYIEEVMINRTEGYSFGESGLYEPFTEDKGELFRNLRKKYGRCISKVRVDTDKKTLTIGWVFLKRAKYEDTNDTYLQETWVTLHKDQPTITHEYRYEEIE